LVALMLTALAVVLMLYFLVQGVVFMTNLFAFPPLMNRKQPEPPPHSERVSLLVPVRDEADILPHTLPTWLKQDVAEIVLLDDASTDGSSVLLQQAAMQDERVTVLQGDPDVPSGWNGKNWACHRLAEHAHGDVLLFVDADVFLSEGAVQAAASERFRMEAALLTVWPRQRLGTALERAVVPQFMLWTRDAYLRAGGHEGVRGDALEDVKLARAVKRNGGRLGLRLGGRMVEARMYRSNRAVVEGFSKNILEAAGSRVALVLWTLLALLAYTLVWPLALLDLRFLALGVAGLLLRAGVEARSGRNPLLALLQPLAQVVVVWVAWLAFRQGRAYRWKGRTFTGGGTSHAK
jgi:glycosyltransferase involved in cell wall biosynthesis